MVKSLKGHRGYMPLTTSNSTYKLSYNLSMLTPVDVVNPCIIIYFAPPPLKTANTLRQ